MSRSIPPAEVAQADEGGDPPEHLGLDQQRRMALVGHLYHVDVEMTRAHGLDGVGGEVVGIGAADHHQGRARERGELVPQRGQRPLEVELLERLDELRVVAREHAAVLVLPQEPGLAQPAVAVELGKLAGADALQDLGALLERARRRKLADVALDAHQALRLDHRTDVVEDDAGDRGRPRRRQQHGEDAAARGADEDRGGELERGDDGEHVVQLDLQAVAAGIAVVVGLPAAAIVKGEHAARLDRVARQHLRQLVEILRRAGETRQAEDRQGRREARPMLAHVQSQAVRRRDAQTPRLDGHDRARRGRRRRFRRLLLDDVHAASIREAGRGAREDGRAYNLSLFFGRTNSNLFNVFSTANPQYPRTSASGGLGKKGLTVKIEIVYRANPKRFGARAFLRGPLTRLASLADLSRKGRVEEEPNAIPLPRPRVIDRINAESMGSTADQIVASHPRSVGRTNPTQKPGGLGRTNPTLLRSSFWQNEPNGRLTLLAERTQ